MIKIGSFLWIDPKLVKAVDDAGTYPVVWLEGVPSAFIATEIAADELIALVERAKTDE